MKVRYFGLHHPAKRRTLALVRAAEDARHQKARQAQLQHDAGLRAVAAVDEDLPDLAHGDRHAADVQVQHRGDGERRQ